MENVYFLFIGSWPKHRLFKNHWKSSRNIWLILRIGTMRWWRKIKLRSRHWWTDMTRKRGWFWTRIRRRCNEVMRNLRKFMKKCSIWTNTNKEGKSTYSQSSNWIKDWSKCRTNNRKILTISTTATTANDRDYKNKPYSKCRKLKNMK